MKTILLNLLAFALLLITAGCPLSQNCEGLIYEPDTNTCVCPMGTEPDYELDACVGDDGVIIPWGGLPVPLFDSGVVADASVSGSISDMGSDVFDSAADAIDSGSELDMQMMIDAGSPPAPTTARFPWNGFTTGSIHVLPGSVVVDHPLRPKLMWEPVAGASDFHVQMTRECSIEGFRTCAFESPELDERTTETTFRPSEVLPVAMDQTLDNPTDQAIGSFGQSVAGAGDVNGDGFADLLVGASFQSAPERYEGNAFVYFGGRVGVSTEPDRTLDNPGDQERGAFGHSVAGAGDVDADGYADVIVGAPSQDAPEMDEGNAFLYGSEAGVSAGRHQVLDNPVDQAGGEFGWSVASAGDAGTAMSM